MGNSQNTRFGLGRFASVLPLLVGATALAGCMNTTDQGLQNQATYQQGYVDGCTTGNQRSRGFSETVKRNDGLWDRDEAYRVGWRQGYVVCGGTEVEQNQEKQDFLTTDRFDQGPI